MQEVCLLSDLYTCSTQTAALNKLLSSMHSTVSLLSIILYTGHTQLSNWLLNDEKHCQGLQIFNYAVKHGSIQRACGQKYLLIVPR
jgi:hypothetical protein